MVIIPKQIRLRVEDLSNEEALDLFHVSKMIAAKLEKHYQGTSLNFGIQDGPESGQSVQVNISYLFNLNLNLMVLV